MMKHPVKKYFFLFILIGWLVFLGYYRDFLFRTMNSILQAKDYEAVYTVPTSLIFLSQFDYTTLLALKWVFTLVFSLIYLVVALITLKIIFNKKKYNYIAIGLYAFITIVSALFIFAGYAFSGISDTMYEFARYLMGMAQSPVILMILIPAFKLSEQEQANIEN